MKPDGRFSRARTNVPASRASASALLPAIFTITTVLLALGAWYAHRFENLGTVWDLWFGADIPRIIRWTLEPANVGRAHLHPLPVVPLKLYGFLLELLHAPLSPRYLPAFALPLILVVAACTAATSRTLIRTLGERRSDARETRGVGHPVEDHVRSIGNTAPIATTHGRAPGGASRSLAIALGLISFASMLAFAPVPECHAAGGALLLLQASFVLRWLACEKQDASPRLRTWIVLSGAAAAGFTLSNLMPALILAAAVIPSWHSSTRRVAREALLALGAMAVVIAIGQYAGPPNPIRESIDYEMEWTYLPTLTTLRESFIGLVVYQFGIPRVGINTWDNPLDGTTVASIAPAGPSLLHSWRSCSGSPESRCGGTTGDARHRAELRRSRRLGGGVARGVSFDLWKLRILCGVTAHLALCGTPRVRCPSGELAPQTLAHGRPAHHLHAARRRAIHPGSVVIEQPAHAARTHRLRGIPGPGSDRADAGSWIGSCNRRRIRHACRIRTSKFEGKVIPTVAIR